MNRKILFVEIIGRGEFLWNLPLAAALRAHGHDVEFLTLAANQDDCRRAGVGFTEWAIPPEASRALEAPGKQSHGNWLKEGIRRWRMRARVQTSMMPGLYERIEREYRDYRLLLVARHNALGARLAHEKLGVPLVGVYPNPAPLRTCYHEPGLPIPPGNGRILRAARGAMWWGIDRVADHFLLPEFNNQRCHLGLRPIRRPFHRWVESPGLNVGLWPECFAPRQPDWPENLVIANPPMVLEELSPVHKELAEFLEAGEAPVVFTRGSHVRMEARFFETAIAVCERLGARGVLAGSTPVQGRDRFPPSVFASGFVPFHKLLPRAAAIVHHGGIGTTLHALAAGIPQVVTPMFDDQFYNARRAEQLGVGVLLRRREWHPEGIANALTRLLSSPEVSVRCRSLAKEVRSSCGLDPVCAAIEKYWDEALRHA